MSQTYPAGSCRGPGLLSASALASLLQQQGSSYLSLSCWTVFPDDGHFQEIKDIEQN